MPDSLSDQRGPRVVRAPWGDVFVAWLNAGQEDSRQHGYTCTNGHPLVAFNDGWSCPRCSYTQDWAHEPALWALVDDMATVPPLVDDAPRALKADEEAQALRDGNERLREAAVDLQNRVLELRREADALQAEIERLRKATLTDLQAVRDLLHRDSSGTPLPFTRPAREYVDDAIDRLLETRPASDEAEATDAV